MVEENMPEEIEKTIEKGAKKNPYTLWKLLNRWLLALFLMLLVFPLLGGIAPFIQTLTLFGIIAYTIFFLLKRKQFIEKERSRNSKSNR